MRRTSSRRTKPIEFFGFVIASSQNARASTICRYERETRITGIRINEKRSSHGDTRVTTRSEIPHLDFDLSGSGAFPKFVYAERHAVRFDGDDGSGENDA